MCIIAFRPENVPQVSAETLEVCWQNNDDGCGLSYIEDGKLKVYKFLDFKVFMEHWVGVKDLKSPFLYHFRIRTHGAVSLENCHPFRIDKDHVFAHNGVISDCAELNSPFSDTLLFKNKILSKLPKGWFEDFDTKKLIENYIGFSKIVVLRSDGQYKIYNEFKGEKCEGIWYSNGGFKHTKQNWQNDDYCGVHHVPAVRDVREAWKREFGRRWANNNKKRFKGEDTQVPDRGLLSWADVEYNINENDLNAPIRIHNQEPDECSWCGDKVLWVNEVRMFTDKWEICDACLQNVKNTRNAENYARRLDPIDVMNHFYPGD